MDVTTTWVDARLDNPRDGDLVLAAVTGRYPTDGKDPPSQQDFWLVLPMHFRHRHDVEGTDDIVWDCYRDADGVIRKAHGSGTDEQVTHWAVLPSLPCLPDNELVGEGVQSAVAAAMSTSRPRPS